MNDIWLELLTKSSYIAIVYNERGEPQTALNRWEHRLLFTVEHLLKGSLFEYYEVPAVKDLNALFSGAGPEQLDFESRNKVEYQAVSGFIRTRLPLSSLRLVRTGPSKFVGIVSFDETFLPLFSEKPAVAADEAGKILIHNDLFAEAAAGAGNADLLGRPLDEFLAFDQKALAPPKDAPGPESAPLLRWQCPARPPFDSSAAYAG